MSMQSEYDKLSVLENGDLLLAAGRAAYGDLWRRRLPARLGVSASYVQHVIDGTRPMSAKLRAAFEDFLAHEGERLIAEAQAADRTFHVIRFIIRNPRKPRR